MAKYSNKVNELFEASGHYYRGNNRNRAHRGLSTLIDSGVLSFELCDPGKIWITKGSDGKDIKFNIKIRFPGLGKYCRYYYKSTSIEAYDVLRFCGKALQNPVIKEHIKSFVDIDSRCHRCGGEGYIRMFNYYCDGVCFDCYGSGFNHRHHHTVELIK